MALNHRTLLTGPAPSNVSWGDHFGGSSLPYGYTLSFCVQRPNGTGLIHFWGLRSPTAMCSLPCFSCARLRSTRMCPSTGHTPNLTLASATGAGRAHKRHGYTLRGPNCVTTTDLSALHRGAERPLPTVQCLPHLTGTPGTSYVHLRQNYKAGKVSAHSQGDRFVIKS